MAESKDGKQTAHLSPFQQALARFWAQRSTRMFCWFFVVLFLLGVYAPFIAGEAALIWWDATGISFPVIEQMFNFNIVKQRHDILFNVLALLIPPGALGMWLLRRRFSFGKRLAVFALLVVAVWGLVQIPMWSPLQDDGPRRAMWDRRPVTKQHIRAYLHTKELQQQGTAALQNGDVVRDAQDSFWTVRYVDTETNEVSARRHGSGPRGEVASLPVDAIEPVIPGLVILPLIPHDYFEPYEGAVLTGIGTVNATTGERFWLGTDQVGHDVLTMMIFGIRISLTIGLLATGIAFCIGIFIGAISAYLGGWVDLVLQRVVEIVMTLPVFIVTLIVISVFGKNIFLIIIVTGLLGWAGTARLVRGEFLAQVEREYVLACRSMGFSKMRIMFRHILPNAMTPLLVAAPFAIAGAVLNESGLAFLGLVESDTPSWGIILNNGRDKIEYPHLIYAPGLAIFVLVYGLNMLGNALREAFDPKGTS